MIRLLADHNFRRPILAAVHAAVPRIDLVETKQIGLQAAPDPQVLQWAADHDRVVLTHDRDTMPRFAIDRMNAGLPFPGLVVVGATAPHNWVVEDVVTLLLAGSLDDTRNQVLYFPYPRR